MRIKFLLAAALIAGAGLAAFAQTHVEGVEYYKADQFNNAKELLLRNMNNAGTDKAISNYYLGLIALEEGKKDDAQRYFDNGVAANPEYPFNYVGEGQLALMNGDVKAAESFFKEAKSKNKVKEDKASLDIAIARAYYNVDPAKYAKEIDKNVAQAQKDSPKQGTAYTDPSIYVFDGDRYKDQRDAGKAGSQYEMATTYNPNATEAYVKYANLFTQVNPQYAINMLQNLLKVNPQSALGQRELAAAYYNAGKYKEAAAEYEKYIQNPNHFKQDEDRYSFLLFYDGRFKDGFDYATELLASNPDNFTAQRFQFMNAAQIEDMRSQLLPYAEKLLAAHKQNPEKNKFAPIDYILIGGELSDADRPQEAQALFEEAIADDPENPEFYKQLALVFVNEQNLSKAAETFENYIAKKENPGYNDYVQQATYAFYAGIENQQSNPDAAQKFYTMASENADKAQQIASTYPKPLKIKGDIAKQTADASQVASAAVPYYTEAIALIEASQDPSRYKSDAKEMYNYMGNYYLEQNDKPTAITYFEKVVELDPDNTAYRDFVNGLK